MIDDLVTKELMSLIATSHCRYRLILHHDNADMRLAEMGRGGLVDDERWARLKSRKINLTMRMKRLDGIKLKPAKKPMLRLRRWDSS